MPSDKAADGHTENSYEVFTKVQTGIAATAILAPQPGIFPSLISKAAVETCWATCAASCFVHKMQTRIIMLSIDIGAGNCTTYHWQMSDE